MDIPKPTGSAGDTNAEFDALAALFGGSKALKHSIANSLDAHELILQGIPGQALDNLVASLSIIDGPDAFAAAFGMSERTFQRRKVDNKRALNSEQSSRTWSFAKTLAKATVIFGSQSEAEKWLVQPAMGLDDRRPIDLLSTCAGTEIVQEFLDRLDHGVYA